MLKITFNFILFIDNLLTDFVICLGFQKKSFHVILNNVVDYLVQTLALEECLCIMCYHLNFVLALYGCTLLIDSK